MLWFRCCGMAHNSSYWFRINLTQIVRKISWQTSSIENAYTKTSVINAKTNASERFIHVSRSQNDKEKDEYYAQLALKETKAKELVSQEFFEESSEKNRQTFKNAIELFNKRDIRKRGSVEFIYAALKHMKQFNCNR